MWFDKAIFKAIHFKFGDMMGLNISFLIFNEKHIASVTVAMVTATVLDFKGIVVFNSIVSYFCTGTNNKCVLINTE